MNMKRNGIFICAFSLLICTFLIWYPLAHQGVLPWNTLDLGITQTAATYDGFLGGYKTLVAKYKTKIENLLTQQFPGYVPSLELNNQMNYEVNQVLYQGVLGEDYAFLPASHSDAYNTYISKDGSYLMRTETFDKSEESRRQVNDMINDLARRHPELSVNVYQVPDIGCTNVLGQIPGFMDQLDYSEDLRLGFDENLVSTGRLEYDSLEEFHQYFLKSDHHWNFTGAYQGYQDIIAMLEENFPEIGAPREMKGYRYAAEDIHYQGSLARMAMNTTIYDVLYDGDIEVPPYQVQINGGEWLSTIYPNKERYFNGEVDPPPYYSQYADFFHWDSREIHYVFDNGTGRNLLIFADSISDNMDELVASHFDHTYVIDLRMVEEGFTFEEYIKEKNITDVLFLNLSSTMLNAYPDYEKYFAE